MKFKMVDKIWFKIFTVVLFSYVFIGGMLRPLNPGIKELSPISVKSGASVQIAVNTYNTHLKQGEVNGYLKLDSLYALPSKAVTVNGPSSGIFDFDIPAVFPDGQKSSNVTLIIASKTDGTFIRPDAIWIDLDSTKAIQAGMNWQKDIIKNLPVASNVGFPFRLILEETIRNVFYHVPLWFAMFILYSIAAFQGLKFIRKNKAEDLMKSYSYNRVGFYFGILGLLTGSVWARFTWGTFWTGDIKLNMTAIAMLIYAAYFILWNSFKDDQLRGRICSVYSIFAFVAMIPLIFVIPRLYDSLHPGNGGNPALGGEDLDNTLRTVFYPAVIAFTCLGLWLVNLTYKLTRINHKLLGE